MSKDQKRLAPVVSLDKIREKKRIEARKKIFDKLLEHARKLPW